MNDQKRTRLAQSLALMIASIFMTASSGCNVLGPVPIEIQDQNFATQLIDSENPQIEIGKPHSFLDGFGWGFGIPDKILLWDRRVENHKISEETILATADYLQQNNLPHVKVRANQYAPLKDWKRLQNNKTIAWPWRYSLGTLSVAGEAILPGRLFGGDHYNPFTQTIHLYSDIPAVALHEAAHAKDFTRREYQGSYAAAYLILPLWHETIATEDVFDYLGQTKDHDQIAEANRILYPAYGTYVGNTLGPLVPSNALPLYYGSVVAGHINGRLLNQRLPRHKEHSIVVETDVARDGLEEGIALQDESKTDPQSAIQLTSMESETSVESNSTPVDTAQ